MKRFSLLCILFMWCALAHAQRYKHDLQLITGIQINKDLPKGFDVSVQYQFRANNYLQHIRGSYMYASVGYTIIKKVLSAEFQYRFSTSNERNQHRFGLGMIAKHKIGEFTFSDRLVYQREHEYFNAQYENGHEPSNTLRNRVQIKWDFKKRWDAYVSCEPFFKISNEEKEISRIRTVAGMDWEFKKNHTINLFYQYQTQVHNTDPEMLHTIGCRYGWDIPKKKKKE